MSPDASHLVHYTDSPATVTSILENGFLLVPNKRYLINALLGEELFSDREPQEFGMVSFTQLPIGSSAAHREHFGSFAVVVSWEWALANGTQRVIYVDERGPIAETFAWLFRYAKQELERAEAGKPSRMTLENKAFGSWSQSTIWSRLLNLYEFMEPERNSAQVEWRIVNDLPQYHQVATRVELIAELLATTKLWKNMGSVRVTPQDIIAFICPRSHRAALAAALPEQFAAIPILTHRGSQQLSRLQRARDKALFAHRGRERVVRELEPPPTDTWWLRKDSNGAYYLPEVGRIRGARLFQDELMIATRILIQYQSTTGPLCDLVIPLHDTFYLMNVLRYLQKRSGLDPLNPLPPLERPRDILVGQMRIGMAR